MAEGVGRHKIVLFVPLQEDRAERGNGEVELRVAVVGWNGDGLLLIREIDDREGATVVERDIEGHERAVVDVQADARKAGDVVEKVLIENAKLLAVKHFGGGWLPEDGFVSRRNVGHERLGVRQADWLEIGLQAEFSQTV